MSRAEELALDASTAPACSKCGAALPDVVGKGIVRCPKCKHPNELRTREDVADNEAPLLTPGFFDEPAPQGLTQEQGGDAKDAEIARLRAELAKACVCASCRAKFARWAIAPHSDETVAHKACRDAYNYLALHGKPTRENTEAWLSEILIQEREDIAEILAENARLRAAADAPATAPTEPA